MTSKPPQSDDDPNKDLPILDWHKTPRDDLPVIPFKGPKDRQSQDLPVIELNTPPRADLPVISFNRPAGHPRSLSNNEGNPVPHLQRESSAEVARTLALRPDLEDVLSELPLILPPSFHEGARRIAGYIQELEGERDGKSVSPEADAFARFLFNTGFVNKLIFIKLPWFEVTFPDWLETRKRIPDHLSPEQAEKAIAFIQSYGERHGEEERTITGQVYYYRKGRNCPPQSENMSFRMKAYIEDGALLQQDEINEILEQLSQRGIHPNLSKNLADEGWRWVLYWNGLDSESQAFIQELFAQHAVPLRAFGQDSAQIIRDKSGEIIVDNLHSNDEGLGEGGSTDWIWREAEYDPAQFLRAWLRLTFRACKRPDQPYLLAFVPAMISGDESDFIVRAGEIKTSVPKLFLRFVTTSFDIFDQAKVDRYLA